MSSFSTFSPVSVSTSCCFSLSSLFVDPVERNALRARRGRIKRDRARNQGQLEITLPGGTRGHGTLLTQTDSSGADLPARKATIIPNSCGCTEHFLNRENGPRTWAICRQI